MLTLEDKIKIINLARQEDPKLSYEDIGKIYELSRSRIHQIVKGYANPVRNKGTVENLLDRFRGGV